MLHGLAETGFDIRNWDMVVGTSAGAVVGAKLLGEPDFEAWFATQLLDDTTADDEIVEFPPDSLANFGGGDGWAGSPGCG